MSFEAHAEVVAGSQEAWRKAKEEIYQSRGRIHKVCFFGLVSKKRIQRRQPKEEEEIQNTDCEDPPDKKKKKCSQKEERQQKAELQRPEERMILQGNVFHERDAAAAAETPF